MMGAFRGIWTALFVLAALASAPVAAQTISSTGPSLASQGVSSMRANRWVYIGDSRVAQGVRNRVRSGGSWPLLAETSINPYYWATVLEPRLKAVDWIDGSAGTRLTNGSDQGISGDTMAQILARLPAVLAAYHPAIVQIEGGVNSLTAGTTASTVLAQLDQAVQLAQAANARVIVEAVFVQDVTGSAVGANMVAGGVGRDQLRQYNELLRRYCSARGLTFIDPNVALMNPTSQYGTPITGYLRDGVHFAPLGAYAYGKYLATIYTKFFPLLPTPTLGTADFYNATNNPYGGLIANPLFTQATPGTTITPGSQLTAGITAGSTGGGDFAGAADQVAIQRLSGTSTGVATITPITDKIGMPRGWGQKVVFTPAGTGNNRFIIRKFGDIINSPLLATGTWVEMCGYISVNADPGWLGAGVSLFDFNNAGTPAEQFEAQGLPPYDNTGSSGFLPFPTEAWSGIVCTPPFQVGGETTSTGLKPRVEIYFDPTVAVAPTIIVGDWQVRVTDDPRWQ